jgi:NAD(P)-dependent dehydrogenase (short-subunit alcohol dehydrogenase family)
MMYKTALITGATRGVGAAVVKALTAAGIKVFATGRDAALLQNLIDATGCAGRVCDLTNPDDVVALFKDAEHSLGEVDVLINNAGFNSRKSELVATTLDEFEQQYAVNLRAPYLLCREALKGMLARKRGYIINIISTVAKRNSETMGVYTAMKKGLDGLSGVLMKEAQPHGIKVTAVYPGGINTEFRAQAKPHYMKPDSAAYMIVELLFNPYDVVVHELVFRPMAELE